MPLCLPKDSAVPALIGGRAFRRTPRRRLSLGASLSAHLPTSHRDGRPTDHRGRYYRAAAAAAGLPLEARRRTGDGLQVSESRPLFLFAAALTLSRSLLAGGIAAGLSFATMSSCIFVRAAPAASILSRYAACAFSLSHLISLALFRANRGAARLSRLPRQAERRRPARRVQRPPPRRQDDAPIHLCAVPCGR